MPLVDAQANCLEYYFQNFLSPVNTIDVCRTCARRLYEAGVDIEAIRQNLGHSDRKTTQGYIGTLGAELRKPPAVYDFDLGGLSEAAVLV